MAVKNIMIVGVGGQGTLLTSRILGGLTIAGGYDVKLEALRYAHFLKKDGVLIVNDWRIDPMPVVIGAAQYPENILEDLEKDHKVYKVNATEESKKLGNPRVFNLIVLGIAAQHMDFTKEQWYEVIEKTVPPKTVEINKKAFDVGYGIAQ